MYQLWVLMARWWWQGRQCAKRQAEQQRRVEIIALGEAMRERQLNQKDQAQR